MKIDCPKCGSESAWYTKDRYDVILRCMCGYYRVVQTKLESIVVHHRDRPEDVKLPRRDSNLWFTIVVLAGLVKASSREITDRLHDLDKTFSVSDVASYLTILRSKQLVNTTEIRRGVAGGSTWILCDRTKDLLGV